MALLYIETFKQSIASVKKQVKYAGGKSCAVNLQTGPVCQDDTRAEHLHLALQMDK